MLSESEANEGQLHIFDFLNISEEISEKQGAVTLSLRLIDIENK